MRARSSNLCLIQGCNVVLIFVGLAAVGLAGSQFSDVQLNTYRNIDLRLLNWVHALTGSIGIYSSVRNHGIAVAKVLCLVSLVIGTATAVFYGFTTYHIVKVHDNLASTTVPPGVTIAPIDGFDNNYAARVVISALMIGVGFLAGVMSLLLALLLDHILVLSETVYPMQSREQVLAIRRSNVTLASVALIKLFLGVGVLGLSVFVEYEHEKIATDSCTWCIKIALEHIAAMLAIVSSAAEILASRGGKLRRTELLVALGISVVAAVWCIKSVDNNMMPYYKDDLKVYYNGKEFRGNWSSSSQYIIVIAHGVLIGCFGLLFFLCALSSAIVGSCLQIDLAVVNSSGLEEKTFLFRFLALLHIFWGSALLALCVLGLIDVSWRGEFLGADLLWMVVLFCSTAILGFSNHRTLVSTQLVMNLACLGIAIEKMCASINLIYQFSSYVVYVRGDNHIYISQIVLISVQTGVLAAEVLTALVCSVLLGNELRRQHSFAKQWQSRGTALLCSSTSLFYGVVLTGCYVVFELGKWRYNEVPLEIPFFRLGNGPLALVAFIVQVLSFWMSWLFAVAVVIQILIAALALFTISSAITNVYYMQILLSTTELARTDRQTTIYDVSLILSAGAALACCLATLGGSLYALFYRSIPYEGGPLLAVDGRTESEPSVQLLSPLPTISSPNLVPGQLMEEQTAYCSTDENPFYYHTSRRYYRQPYTVESGFYGYTLTTPRTPQHRDFASSSSQTQIGHVFAEHHKSS